MSAISTILARLRAAIWAIDVRDDIANAIEQCYSDVSNPTLQTEALEAALQTKIDEGEMAALTIGDHTITAAKLANGVIPAADATLTISGGYADAKKTGDEIASVKADLGAISFFKDHYISLSGDPVDVDNPSTSTAGRACAVVDCSEGDEFVINATSTSPAHPWGFINSGNHIVSMADAFGTVENLSVTAPENATKLIINDMSGSISYKVGNNLASKVGLSVSYLPQELSEEQKAQARENIGVVIPGQELFESKFAFRLLAGNIASNGNMDTSYTKRLITRGPIYLRAGDQIVSDNTSLVVFGLMRYSSADASSSTFVGNIKSVTATPNPLTIPEDGWYIPIVQFVDSRTVTTENRVTAARYVYGIRKSLLAVQPGELDEKYCFWFSSTGTDEQYTTGLWVRGLNSYKTRVHTLPFKLKKGMSVSFPSGMMYQICKYDDGDMRQNNTASGLNYGPGAYSPSIDEWITLNIGKSDNTEYSSLAEAQAAATSITFSESGDASYESPVYDAKENGCVGDGVADDSPIIQTILNKIRDNGGGKIYFPAGTYKVNSTLILYSNTTVEMDEGATLLRGANIKFVFLTNCSDATLSYNGEKNIVVRGGKIDIGTGFTQGACAFGFVHAQNIRVENVETVHNNEGYHMYDICGCKNVKVKDCYLHDPITTQDSAELIQFDGAGSYTQFPSPQLTDGAATFDDTPCVDIEVSGCTFELNSYSPALGNHNGQANKNINVHDCIITGTGGTRGAVAFATATETTTVNATTQVLIHHNIFEGCSIGFTFSNVSTGKIYVRDNIFKGITTLKANPDSPVGEFLNNIELE